MSTSFAVEKAVSLADSLSPAANMMPFNVAKDLDRSSSCLSVVTCDPSTRRSRMVTDLATRSGDVRLLLRCKKLIATAVKCSYGSEFPGDLRNRTVPMLDLACAEPRGPNRTAASKL